MRTLIFGLLLLLGAAAHANDLPFNPGVSPWGSAQSDPALGEEIARSPLPASQAFRTQVRAEEGGHIHVSFTSMPDYYIYVDSISLESQGVVLGSFEKPSGEMVDDETFGRVQVVRGTATIQVPMVSRNAESGEIVVNFQGCLEKSVCYLPESRSVSLGLPASIPFSSEQPASSHDHDHDGEHFLSSMAEDQRLASLLGDRHPLVSLGIFFGLGVLLGLTPCVLPMVPVVLGMVAGAQASGRRTAALAGTYVVAHAIVFAILGLAAAWLGSNLMASFQGAWAIIPLAVVMAGMGAALLMGVRIQVPSAIQAWAGKQGQGGSLPGAAAMGGVSSLIIGPCVAPPLAAVVFYLAHEGNPWLGAGAFFALGLGMGVPMMAAAMGFRNALGRVKQMGRVLIAGMGGSLILVGAWLATRVIPTEVVAIALVVLMVGMGAYSLARNKPDSRSLAMRQTWGYALGALLALSWALLPSSEPSHSAFDTTLAAQDLEQALEQAEQEGKIVAVDFHADWCTSCVEMERTTLSSPAVHSSIQESGIIPFKVDVTKNSPADRELLQSYGLVGPPAILFFRDGEEARHLRLIGVESEKPFLERLGAAQCPSQQPSADTAAC